MAIQRRITLKRIDATGVFTLTVIRPLCSAGKAEGRCCIYARLVKFGKGKVMRTMLSLAVFLGGSLLLSSPAQAAPPEVVGRYEGTFNFKAYNVATGEKSPGNTAAILQINANDTWSLGLNNFAVFTGTGTFGSTVGALRFQDAVNEMQTSLRFKGSSAKGTFLNTMVLGEKQVMEAKLSLKREE